MLDKFLDNRRRGMNADHLEIGRAQGTKSVHCFRRDRDDIARVSMQLLILGFNPNLAMQHDPGFRIGMPVKSRATSGR